MLNCLEMRTQRSLAIFFRMQSFETLGNEKKREKRMHMGRGIVCCKNNMRATKVESSEAIGSIERGSNLEEIQLHEWRQLSQEAERQNRREKERDNGQDRSRRTCWNIENTSREDSRYFRLQRVLIYRMEKGPSHAHEETDQGHIS